MRLGRMAPRGRAAGADQGEHMPIFTMEIDKRAVMAFSGNYSLKPDWDQVRSSTC
jgi:hypothetical protein